MGGMLPAETDNHQSMLPSHPITSLDLLHFKQRLHHKCKSGTFLLQNIKKMKRGEVPEKKSKRGAAEKNANLLEKKSKKSHNAEKLKGDPLVSFGFVCYAEKKEQLFWFSSSGQMVQFGPLNFAELGRTILVSSCGLITKNTY